MAKFSQGNLVLSSGQNIQLDSYTINEFSNDGNLTSNSSSTLVTERAVKEYVDSLVAATSGATGDLTTHINDVSTHGTTTAIVGIDDSQTLTNKIFTSPDINGGTVDLITSLTVANNIDIGSYKFTAQQLESDIATGTAPLVVASETMVDNFNADMLDGYEGSEFLLIANIDDTPVDSETNAPISSNWAYDHVNDTHGTLDNEIDDLQGDMNTHLVSSGVHFTETDIDGDQLDIDWNPTNYTPDASPSEANDVDDLTAHLKGIDVEIGLLESGYNRRRKVIDIVVSTNAPPTSADGDRYILDFSGAPHAAWNDCRQGQIVEFDSDLTTWVGTSASEGWVCYVDEDDKDAIYIDDGAPSWEFRVTAAHASDHITSGSDEIDGDKLDIDWDPTYYTPSTSPSEASSVDNLTAHLYGIDVEFSTLDGNMAAHLASASVHFTEASIDHDNILNNGSNSHDIIDYKIVQLESHLLSAGVHDVIDQDRTITSIWNIDGSWTIDGAWQFTVTPSSGPPSAGQALCNRDYVDAVAGGGGYHASNHIDGGVDPIDGDKLEVSWIPTYYTRDTTPAEVDSTDDLVAHLYGIDIEFSTLDGNMATHLASSSVHFTEASIDHTAISNIGSHSHAQIDDRIYDLESHIASAGIHMSAASTSNVNTGTSTTLSITPDALAGSNLGEKSICFVPFESDTAVTTGDGTVGFCVPASLNGMDIVEAVATVGTSGSVGQTEIQLRRVRNGVAVDVFSTKLMIDTMEYSSTTSTTTVVINTSNDDLQAGDMLYVDIDDIHDNQAPTGLSVTITARLP